MYGLSDASYLSASRTQIQFLAANDAIANAPELELMRLLWPPQYYYDNFPLHKDAVTIGKATLLASTPVLQFSVTGTNLNRARLVYPDCQTCLHASGPTFATISLGTGKTATGLDASGVKALKQVILCNDEPGKNRCDITFPPALLAIPSDETDTAKSTKPKLEKHDSLAIGTQELTIKGSGLDQIATIRVVGNIVPFRLSLDKEPALVVQLPLTVSANKGQYALWIELTDRSTMSYLISIGSSDKQ